MDVVDSPAENTTPYTDPDPWTYCQLQRIVQHMSRLAWFAQKTGLHQLRHGDAYLLAQHCKDRDTARNLMGQQTDSEAFSAYIFKTSTTDIQGLAHSIAPYDLTPFSGLDLGKCSNAPVTLPAKELAAINSHPEFIEVWKNPRRQKGHVLINLDPLKRLEKQPNNQQSHYSYSKDMKLSWPARIGNGND
ncbi:hypothetical protein OIDMADRAFT_53117 [Oidiodendron maius Zn]|uniref:Uncharacterized protein n=1 Tax=Oidiodendron maius (strain Zn) TaxID=913774 RepID=A0A0C3CRF8_OIDMZ|nr:hypothetical protein OIDMADRAFT_53117 [Oidiodendron maius Zn]